MRHTLFCWLALLPAGCGGADSSSATPSAEVARGQSLYAADCASCHGPQGHADGPLGRNFPGLRDFGKHPWRTSPDAPSVRKAITEGIPGTPMPRFSKYSPADLDALVQFVLTLAPREPAPAVAAGYPFAEAGFTAEGSPTLAPPLEFVDLRQQPASLADSSGAVRVVYLFSRTHANLAEDFAALQALLGLQPPVRVLAIALDENDPDEAASLTRPHAGKVPVYVVKNRKSLEPFGPRGTATTLLLDGKGVMLARTNGALEGAALQRLLGTMSK